MELTINKLKERGLKYNIKRSLFGQPELESLGFWVTLDGVNPINNHISNKNMNPSTSGKEVRKFIGLPPYVGIISHTLAFLSKI